MKYKLAHEIFSALIAIWADKFPHDQVVTAFAQNPKFTTEVVTIENYVKYFVDTLECSDMTPSVKEHFEKIKSDWEKYLKIPNENSDQGADTEPETAPDAFANENLPV